MQKVMKWFAFLFFVGVAIFILFFLFSINSEDFSLKHKEFSLKKEKSSLPQKKKIWVDYLSQTKKRGYFYPVNEIYVKVDLNEKITKTVTYRLFAKIEDPYQLFCLKAELKRYGFRYFLKKEKQGIELLIYSQNIDKLNSFVQVLKKYKIMAQIKPYKEEY